MKKGFTLIEILITIVLVAILAGIGFPSFLKAKQKNDAKQAVICLRDIALAEKVYYAKNATYIDCLNDAAIWTNLGVKVAPGRFGFAVVNAGLNTFTAGATGDDKTTITLTQAGAWGGTSCYVPSS